MVSRDSQDSTSPVTSLDLLMELQGEQQSFRFLTTVTTEIFLQHINHGPQVATFFYIDLKHVSHVIQRGCRIA